MVAQIYPKLTAIWHKLTAKICTWQGVLHISQNLFKEIVKDELINKISFLIIPLGFIYFACEDKVAEEKLVVDSFDITLVDKITTGDGSQSQPELIRFINNIVLV